MTSPSSEPVSTTNQCVIENTELHEAVQRHEVATVRRLLEEGFPVDAPGRYGATALCLAALQFQSTMVELLLRHGADVNAVNENGNTSLHVACRMGLRDNVKLLLDAGARTDMRNHKYRTPGEEAQAWGMTEVFELVQLYDQARKAFDLINEQPPESCRPL